MPPLSAYTPFESLLFFQSLATLGTRPINFASISDILRNNTFVRENVAFNADRLSPEALEELYTTLMREGLDGARAVSLPEQNGVHPEGAQPTNPLKRKIASPRPEVLVDNGRSHASFLPELVSHLYARYKELATREIRNEERRYKEISDEIERLQKEERQNPSQSAPVPTSVQASTVRGPQTKKDFAPEPMDLDVKEERPAQQLRQEPSRPAVQPPLDSKVKQIEQESPRNDILPSSTREELAQPTGPSVSAAATQQPQVLSTQPPAQPHQEQPDRSSSSSNRNRSRSRMMVMHPRQFNKHKPTCLRQRLWRKRQRMDLLYIRSSPPLPQVRVWAICQLLLPCPCKLSMTFTNLLLFLLLLHHHLQQPDL